MRKNLLLLSCLFLNLMAIQAQELTERLYETYEKYKEPSLKERRIKHQDIQPLIQQFRINPKFEVNRVGTSIEGRSLELISVGKGDIDVFLWSQMHGDEPTATQAIFDILHFLESPDFKDEKERILNELRLHFLPMLNPDGAELFQRRNALGIDINRDALRLQSPEGQTLKRVRDSLEADFGFNLHDQSRYYNAELTDKPATISYLATAYNYEKEINEVRSNAMKVIVFMNDIIQKYAPGQVGRYSDDFEPRAFGDNLAKWGTSLILIESGGYQNDLEKQEIRKLNYVSILSAMYSIANKSFQDIPIERYEEIPRNDRKMVDLKIENVTYSLEGKKFILDLGIFRTEIDDATHQDFHINGIIGDQGDLSTYYGYETFDATGYNIVPPKIGNGMVEATKDGFLVSNAATLLKNGEAFTRLAKIPSKVTFSPSPIHLVPQTYQLPEFKLQPGKNATFFLAKEGKLTHAVINGFILDLGKPWTAQQFRNALIYR
ncbi:Peptidase M14 carboxypeptidase A [Croceitalea dokdonensis DOKDO 023]|uniref:Peptidase M14 carboxypeptidase A n=1 Tax=Croceitalea dokdonensis DOKDO 023 TaxID=1300341 RepID=A0A0P7ANG4_9FLAO|nr:M14 metallopeptidase family protein [Croceitalea dokdonensis]KPM33469.1 Peptidase M14 carboxypeptidase A [Croceitalea dokdonensis DOKDO 023]